MRYLLVAPDLGLKPGGEVSPGGLSQFIRCTVRALSSSPTITKLGVWSQVDVKGVEAVVARMLQVHAHPSLHLEVRVFQGSRPKLAYAVAQACLLKSYDRIMYMLVNQSTISALPWHLPYEVWEIGREMFQKVSFWRYRALQHADRLLSISSSTTRIAARENPGLQEAEVVHLCVEPPLYAPEPPEDPVSLESYDPAKRVRAVMIVANMLRGLYHKGHLQLIAAWPEVVATCPEAELWIVGDGGGRPAIESQAKILPPTIRKQIHFLGPLDEQSLHEKFRQCRVFAMPSAGEGFGLVFVEAARFGIPCIGGKYDSVKEIVCDQQTGLLVEQDPHEIAFACRRLLTDDELAKKLGEAGRQRYLNNFRFQHFRDRLLTSLGLEL